jgi:hypothetical protein
MRFKVLSARVTSFERILASGSVMPMRGKSARLPLLIGRRLLGHGSATPMRGKSATCRQVFSEFSGL